MRRYWIARILPKPRNRLKDDDYDVIEADSIQKLLKKLLKFKYWYEIEHVQIMRRSDAVKKGIDLEGRDRDSVSIKELKRDLTKSAVSMRTQISEALRLDRKRIKDKKRGRNYVV